MNTYFSAMALPTRKKKRVNLNAQILKELKAIKRLLAHAETERMIKRRAQAGL